jgi:hypothetical protein
MMRANAGFHSDQAWWHSRQSGFNLPTRPFLPQNNRAPLVEANNMKRVLADIDADRRDPISFLLDMSVLLEMHPLATFAHPRGENTAGPSH